MRVGLHVSKFILINIPFTLQYQIEEENKKFKDIVQGQFIDSYRNLTNKGVMGYKWISEHCMNAEIVLKVDDDAFVNFFKYFEEMSHIKEKKKVQKDK
jgi:beta-1,3-galactosyltransferase 1